MNTATPADARDSVAPLHFVDPRRFKENAREAVNDAHLRASFRSAMATFVMRMFTVTAIDGSLYSPVQM